MSHQAFGLSASSCNGTCFAAMNPCSVKSLADSARADSLETHFDTTVSDIPNILVTSSRPWFLIAESTASFNFFENHEHAPSKLSRDIPGKISAGNYGGVRRTYEVDPGLL